MTKNKTLIEHLEAGHLITSQSRNAMRHFCEIRNEYVYAVSEKVPVEAGALATGGTAYFDDAADAAEEFGKWWDFEIIEL